MNAHNTQLHSLLLLVAIILFVIAALTNTFRTFVRPATAAAPATVGYWPWGGLMFVWAMALFAASFYF